MKKEEQAINETTEEQVVSATEETVSAPAQEVNPPTDIAKAKKKREIKPKEFKKLSLAELKKENKKLDGTDDFFVMIEETPYQVSYDRHFRKSKQHKLLSDLAIFLEESRNKMELLDIMTPYVTLLVLKHFTSIEVSDDIDEAVAMLDVLIDLDIIDKVISHLPKDQVEIVFDLLGMAVETMVENIDAGEEGLEEIVDSIENDEVKDWVKENGDS